MTAPMNNVFPPALKEAFGYRPRDHYFKREDPTCLTGWETFRVDANGAPPEQVWLLRFAVGEPRMALWKHMLSELVQQFAPMAHDPYFLCPIAVQSCEDAVALRVQRPVGRSLWDVRAQQPNGRFDIPTGRYLMQQVAQLAIRYCDIMGRTGYERTPALQLCASDIQVDMDAAGRLLLRLSPDICPSSRNNGFRPIFTPPMSAVLSDYTAPIAELFCKVTGGETGRIHPPPEFPEKEKELLEQIFIHAEQSQETPWTDFLSDLLDIKAQPAASPPITVIETKPPIAVQPEPVNSRQKEPAAVTTPPTYVTSTTVGRMPQPPPPPFPPPPPPAVREPEIVEVKVNPFPEEPKPTQKPKPILVDEPTDQWPPVPVPVPVAAVKKPTPPKTESTFRKSADDWAKRFGASSTPPTATPATPVPATAAARPMQPVPAPASTPAPVQPAHRPSPVVAATSTSVVGGTKWVTSKPPGKTPPPPPPYTARPTPADTAAAAKPKASSFDQVMEEFARMYK